MRSAAWFLVAALVIGVAACDEQSNPLNTATERADTVDGAELSKSGRPTVYAVTQLASLGGASEGNGINNSSTIVGTSNLSTGVERAALWRDGSLIDLGSLGGPNTHSSVVWPGINSRGMVVGIAQTDVEDPLGQSWSCSAFLPSIGHTCRGFVWDADGMTPMPTLGGHNSFATSVNNHGQVVGWAETSIEDPTCDEEDGDQVLQFRAVVWEPRGNQIRELPPLPGDSTSAATAINDRGQVVGISGDCDIAVGRFSARHAVLWDRGEVIDIGNLGGISWHTPMAINQKGDVVGFSNPPGDEDGAFNVQAFLWTRKDGMMPLGRLPGDTGSQALDINERGQVVGLSQGPDGPRAVIWEHGAIGDLNTLAPEYDGQLLYAGSINDRGEITGLARDPTTGETVAFIARPVRGGRQPQSDSVKASGG